eukprot:3121525-Pyramimonas_sp.AAC.1
MCAALKREREPNFEKKPPSHRGALAVFGNECARRYSDNHILKKSRLESVKHWQVSKINVRGATAITKF